MATKFANNSEERKEIATAKGDDLFGREKFVEAAVSYAQSNLSFEDVSIKLLYTSEPALSRYLELKIDTIQKNDKTQGVLLSTWLLELKLAQLNKSESEPNVEAKQHDVSVKEMRFFFSKYREQFHYDTVYDLLARRGLDDLILIFAQVIQDNDRVVRMLLDRSECDQVLKLIAQQVYHQIN